MTFKKGMKCIVTNPTFGFYTKGKIVTLKERKSLDFTNFYWTIEEGLTGVAEIEMKPFNWRDRYG